MIIWTIFSSIRNITTSWGLPGTRKNGQVIDLNSQQKAADLDLTGMPHLGSGITWPYQGTTVLATPNLKEHTVTFIDTQNWKTIKKIDTKGPGFFHAQP